MNPGDEYGNGRINAFKEMIDFCEKEIRSIKLAKSQASHECMVASLDGKKRANLKTLQVLNTKLTKAYQAKAKRLESLNEKEEK